MIKKSMTKEDVVTALGFVVRNLSDIELYEQNLSGMDLSGANFRGSDLYYVDLRYCDLTDVEFWTMYLQSIKGLVSIGGIGSRNDTLYAWRKYNEDRTSFEVIFVTGCFEGTEKQFRQEIKERLAEDPSGYVVHAELYRRAINLLKLMLQQHYPFESKY